MSRHSMEFREKKIVLHESTCDSVEIDGEIPRFGISSTLPTIDELTYILLE